MHTPPQVGQFLVTCQSIALIADSVFPLPVSPVMSHPRQKSSMVQENPPSRKMIGAALLLLTAENSCHPARLAKPMASMPPKPGFAHSTNPAAALLAARSKFIHMLVDSCDALSAAGVANQRIAKRRFFGGIRGQRRQN